MRKGAYHSHMGQEHRETAKYYPERRPVFRRGPNPYGYVCEWCGETINWIYRNGEPWATPRYYCEDSTCQRVREHRVEKIETVEMPRVSLKGRGV